MEAIADILVLVGERGKADVLASLQTGRWEASDLKKKREVLSLAKAPPYAGHRLWWGARNGKGVQLIRPSVQMIRFGNNKQWSQIFSSGRSVIGAKPGPAVLVINDSDVDRWFGVVTLTTRPNELDPTISDTTTKELEPWLGKTICVAGGMHILPPEWGPSELDNGLNLDSTDQINEMICNLLHPAVAQKIDEIGDWVPALRTRLDLEHVAGHSFASTFVDALLKYPAFQARFELERERVEQEATRRLEQARGERDRLEREITDLKSRKLREIGDAIEKLVDDNQTLAIATVLGREPRPGLDLTGIEHALRELSASPRPTLDLVGIEQALRELCARPTPAIIDTEAIVRAISSQSPTDLSPIVNALSHLTQAVRESRRADGIQVRPSLDPFPQIGEEITGSEKFSDLGLTDAQNAIAIIAHSRLLPVACGGLAAECIHGLVNAVVAGRATWWHCSTEITTVNAVLSCPRVASIVQQARANPTRLFALILEGIDRAPTESYLEPLLIMRALGLPLGEDPQTWPSNLLLFATVTSGGQTALSISPGVWVRAVPVVAKPRRVREVSEVTYDFWSGTSPNRVAIALEGLLPKGVEMHPLERLEFSTAHLVGQASEALARGVALASCLSRGDNTKPLGDFSSFGTLVG